MHLMRIGPVGSEKPVARLTDETYVDLSETIHDFDETFFSSGGLRTLPASLLHSCQWRTSSSRRTRRRTYCAPTPDSLRRTQLQRPRRRNRSGDTSRTYSLHQVTQHHYRTK